MNDKIKHALTRIITVAAAVLLVYGYIKLPVDGLDYYHGKYSAVDKQESGYTDSTVKNDADITEDLLSNEAETPEKEDPEVQDNTETPKITTEPKQENTETEAVPVPSESETELPSKNDNEWNDSIELISLTRKVTAGSSASIKIKGTPNTEYTIYVYYSSGASKAKGLEPQVSNSNGYVEWIWKVGVRTKPGSYKIEITDGSVTVETSFEVS